MNKIQISSGMFAAMIVNMIFAKAIGVTQGAIARMVGQDAWISTLLGTLQGLLVMGVVFLALRQAPGREPLDIMRLGDRLLGRWFGSLVTIVVIAFFLAAIGPIFITFVYHLRDYFLPDVPLAFFIVSGLIVGSIGCYYGLEVMGRTAVLGLLFIFLLNILILIGSTDEFDIRNLLPVLEHGLPATAAASIHFDADWALAAMMAAIVLPHIRNRSGRQGRLALAGIAASGMTILIWSMLESAVLSAEVTGQYTVSCMKLARNAHVGTFLQRYEMIMIALYSVPVLFEIMFVQYAVTFCSARLFRLKNEKAAIIPAAIALGAVGYWIVEDHFRALRFLEYAWPFIAVTVAAGLPVLMLLLRLLMPRRAERAERVS